LAARLGGKPAHVKTLDFLRVTAWRTEGSVRNCHAGAF